MSQNISAHIALLKESFLLAAASGGRLLECQSLLELGADVNYCDETNEDTPLIAAVRNGNRPVVSLLLAHGADPTRSDRDNNTVLHIVAEMGDEALATLFCPNASTLCSTTNNDGKTPFDIAVERGLNSFAEHLHHLCANDDEEADNDTYHSSQSSSSSEATPQISSLAFDDDSYEVESSHASASVEINDSNVGEDSFDIAAIGDLPFHGDENDSTRQLQVQLYEAKYALSAVMKERDDLKAELSKIQPFCNGDDSFFAQKTLQELQVFERQVKHILEKIENAKQYLEEEKLCVICRESPKEVLFMPCRHLCVCKDCGHREELERCPLCREVIAERISVFS